MKNQRNSLGSPPVRKHFPASSDPPLLAKPHKDAKPRTTHHSPKHSQTLVRVKSGEWGRTKDKLKGEFSRGKALEVLLEEDLKSAKNLGLWSEVAAIRRVLQAVMERNQEFRGVLENIQQRYEEIIDKAVAEAESAKLSLQKSQEEKKQLLRRLEALSARKPEDLPPQFAVKEPRTLPSSPKNALGNYESTERMNPWTTAKHKHRESASSLPSFSESPSHLKPFCKPQFVPRLRLELLKKPQTATPKGQREAIYIEDM